MSSSFSPLRQRNGGSSLITAPSQLGGSPSLGPLRKSSLQATPLGTPLPTVGGEAGGDSPSSSQLPSLKGTGGRGGSLLISSSVGGAVTPPSRALNALPPLLMQSPPHTQTASAHRRHDADGDDGHLGTAARPAIATNKATGSASPSPSANRTPASLNLSQHRPSNVPSNALGHSGAVTPPLPPVFAPTAMAAARRSTAGNSNGIAGGVGGGALGAPMHHVHVPLSANSSGEGVPKSALSQRSRKGRPYQSNNNGAAYQNNNGATSESEAEYEHSPLSAINAPKKRKAGGGSVQRSNTSLGASAHHRDKYSVEAVYARHAKWLKGHAKEQRAHQDAIQAANARTAAAAAWNSPSRASTDGNRRQRQRGGGEGRREPSNTSRGGGSPSSRSGSPFASRSGSPRGGNASSCESEGLVLVNRRGASTPRKRLTIVPDSGNHFFLPDVSPNNKTASKGAHVNSNACATAATAHATYTYASSSSSRPSAIGSVAANTHTTTPMGPALGPALAGAVGRGASIFYSSPQTAASAAANINSSHRQQVSPLPVATAPHQKSFGYVMVEEVGLGEDGEEGGHHHHPTQRGYLSSRQQAGGGFSRSSSRRDRTTMADVSPSMGALSRTTSGLANVARDVIYPPNSDFDFIQRFEGRLKTVQDRNTEPEIKSVIDKKLQMELEEQRLREEVLGRKDARREQIYADHQSVHERKHLAELGLRGTQFFPMVLAALFLTKCRESLRVYHSFDVHRRLLAPILARKAKVKALKAARDAFTESRLEQNPVPTLAMLRATGGSPKENFFSSWPDADVNFFISLLVPKSFHAGDAVMHAGDMDRVMYIVTQGTVEVQIKKRTGKDKRRNNVNAQCFPLPTPTYVGEFALLCREPRGATIVCTTTVDAWCIGRSDFEKVLASLTPASVFALEEVANNRRKSNMEKFFPIKEEMVREVLGFRHMSDAQIRALIKKMQPHVLRNNTVYISEDEYRPEVAFLTDGVMEMTRPSDPTFAPRRYTKGFAYGVRETLFSQESSPFTVTVVDGGAELWLLTRADFIEVCAFYPGSMKAAAEVLKDEFSARLGLIKAPRVPQCVVNDPFLRHVMLPSALQSMWASPLTTVLVAPMVCAHGDVLMQEGQSANCIYVVQRGTVEIRHGGNMAGSELAARDDEITADPSVGGVYSTRSAACGNLAQFFPHVIRAPAPKGTNNKATAAAAVDENLVAGGGPRTNSVHQPFGVAAPPPAALTNVKSSASTFTMGPRKRSTGTMVPHCPASAVVGGHLPQKQHAVVAAPVALGGGAGAMDDGDGGDGSPQQGARRGGDLFSSSPRGRGGDGGANTAGAACYAPPAPVPLLMDASPQSLAEVGFTVGTYEAASRRTQYSCTVRCLSYCEVWCIEVSPLLWEMQLKGTPHAISAQQCNEMLGYAWAKGYHRQLMGLPAVAGPPIAPQATAKIAGAPSSSPSAPPHHEGGLGGGGGGVPAEAHAEGSGGGGGGVRHPPHIINGKGAVKVVTVDAAVRQRGGGNTVAGRRKGSVGRRRGSTASSSSTSTTAAIVIAPIPYILQHKAELTSIAAANKETAVAIHGHQHQHHHGAGLLVTAGDEVADVGGPSSSFGAAAAAGPRHGAKLSHHSVGAAPLRSQQHLHVHGTRGGNGLSGTPLTLLLAGGVASAGGGIAEHAVATTSPSSGALSPLSPSGLPAAGAASPSLSLSVAAGGDGSPSSSSPSPSHKQRRSPAGPSSPVRLRSTSPMLSSSKSSQAKRAGVR